MQRLASFLDLPVHEAEEHLSRLVVAGAFYARINRPRGIVSFVKQQTPNEVLNQWSSDIDALLGLVENTVHLIQREHMVHKLATAQ